MTEETHVHALDYLSMLRRRQRWLVVPVAASVLVGLVLVRFLPKEYQSSTTLAVTAPAVSPNLVNQPAFDNQERLRALTQLLLSPQILSRVVREEQMATTASPEQQIAALRRAIAIDVPDPVASTNEPRRFDTFIVSYTDRDPARAQRIADRLATVFVDENSRTRTEHAESTSMFIAEQLRASHGRLAMLEERLRDAKEAYMGRLPEQMQANLQTVSGLRQQVEATATELQSEQDRLSMIDRQLEEIKGGSPGALAIAGEGAPESRVLVLQRELAAARTTYTERHPEVQRIQGELTAARIAAEAKNGESGAERLAQLQLDPAYRRLMAERETTLLRVREAQRAATEGRRQIASYQARVDATPRVEQQLSSLQRDYDLEKEQYAALSSKLHASTISENVERNRSGAQFSVLYAANLPDTPVKPVPWRVMVMSILAGICLGGALSLGREYLDRSVHDTRQLKDEFDVPVLGEVTRIQSV
jgi:polysaccharide chain length determinant protein (PEP-CTERM system associated)